MPPNNDPVLDLHEIQGDVLIGLQKNFENFIFFKIVKVSAFKAAMMQYGIAQITTTKQVLDRDHQNQERRRLGVGTNQPWLGLNVSFTKDGLTELLGHDRPRLEAPFENGADNRATWLTLNDPAPATWLSTFRSDRIDGVFFVAGPDEPFVTRHSNGLLGHLADSIGVVHHEMGNVRPYPMRGHEHFGFLDQVSQPGIRGLTLPSNPREPNEGHPGQDLVWPGEFVFGYPGQDPYDPVASGTPRTFPASWVRNGSLMVFRRLEQRVPEFNAFIRREAGNLGIQPERLAARMVGRWASGAPLLLTPHADHPAHGQDPQRNNDFEYSSDPLQRACPYAAHIRKNNPRDDPSSNRAEVQTHRIIRAGIPFGPEVGKDEATVTRRRRGLMFVCYQTSIQKQFEFLQSEANDIRFVGGKTRRSGGRGGGVTPGYDPILGQAPGQGPRSMDEPLSPAGRLDMPDHWVVLTAAAYFFVPSITGLLTLLN